MNWDYIKPGIDEDDNPSDEIVWDRLRSLRNELLIRSDWTQIPDCTIANKEEWAAYRQALRDLPSTVTDPREAVFPTAP